MDSFDQFDNPQEMLKEVNEASKEAPQKEGSQETAPQDAKEAPQEPPQKEPTLDVHSVSPDILEPSKDETQEPQKEPQKQEPQKEPEIVRKEVYEYLHPDFIKLTPQYREISEGLKVVDEMRSYLEKQLALAHEGKPIRLVKEITDKGEIVYDEERTPSGADIVELQKQLLTSEGYRQQLSARIKEMDERAAQSHKAVAVVVDAIDKNLFAKLDFEKNALLKTAYDRFKSSIPDFLLSIPLFNSYVKLLAVNEAMAKVLEERSRASGLLGKAQKHAGPTSVDVGAVEKDMEKWERMMDQVMRS